MTINQTLAAHQEKTGKTKAIFTALAVTALLASAAAGGAGFMIYHEFSAIPAAARLTASHEASSQPAQNAAPATREGWVSTAPMYRPVAATSADRSDYQFADNTVLPPAAARRVIAAWVSNPLLPKIPAPLSPAASIPAAGLGATGGEVAEVRRALPVPVAIQTPPPEVRVASAVQVRAALPVDPEAVDGTDTAGSDASVEVENAPVRRAQPVTSGRRFDASSYLASQDATPVLHGEIVNPTSRAAGYHHDFRLP